MARYDYLNNYLNSNMNTYKSGGMFTSYNVGGTHEQNPNGGIPLGDDATVEQGETSVNLDEQGTPTQQPTGKKYIFSDRQVWTPEEIKMAGLPATRTPVTAGQYMAKLNEKFKDKAGSKADKETLDSFTKRATKLAEQKRMQKEQLDRAMQLNSQEIAPENTEIPEGMEEYAEPQQFSPGGTWSNYFNQAGNQVDTSAITAPDMPTSLSGGIGSISDSADAAGATSGALSNAGSYIQAAGTAFDLYNTAKKGNTSTNKGSAIGQGALKGASSGMAFGPWGAAIGALAGGVSGYIGSEKANKLQDEEQNRAIFQINSGMPNSSAWTGVGGSRMSAYGGYVGSFKDGGIHINPANRGKFNATKARTGKSTEELTHSSNPLTRKRAIFAQNAAKWHHADGGPINPFPQVPSTFETLTSVGRQQLPKAARSKPLTFEDINDEYSKFANAKIDTLSANDKVKPSGRYIKLDIGRSRGADIDTNIINAVDAAEKRNNIPRGQIASVLKRERDYGAQLDDNIGKKALAGRTDIDLNVLSNNYKAYERATGYRPERFFADKGVPGVGVIKNVHGWEYPIQDEKAVNDYLKKHPELITQYRNKLKKTAETIGKKNSLDFMADDIKAQGVDKFRRDYNAGFKQHKGLIEQDFKDLQQEKAYNEYLKKLDKRKDGGGYIKPSWLDDPYLQPNTTAMNYPGEGTLSDNDLTKSLAAQYTPSANVSANSGAGDFFGKAGEYAGKAGDWLDQNKNTIMRAYPIISNFIERDKIKKPLGHYSARLNDSFNVPEVDEATAMRDINTAYNNRYRAIGQMGGSQGQQRAAMLGIGAQQNQAISQAQVGLQALRNNRSMQEQQFKHQVAQYNADKNDKDRELYDQDMANYESQRSKFTSQIGNDIGAFGLEQDRMDQVANMYGYDRKGNYLVNKKTGKVATPDEIAKIRAAVSATPTLKAGDKYINEKGETVTVSAYGGYVTRKPSKY